MLIKYRIFTLKPIAAIVSLLFIFSCDALLFEPQIQVVDPPDDGEDFIEAIQVTFPIGGESFDPGSIVTITWDSSIEPCDQGVNIKLFENGDEESIIVINTENDGEFDWYIDTELDLHDDYQIWIESLCYNGQYCNGCIASYSPGTFTITDDVVEPFIIVTNPSGGESYALSEDTLFVEWISSNIPYSIWGMRLSIVDEDTNTIKQLIHGAENDGYDIFSVNEATWSVEIGEPYWVFVESLSENGTTFCGGCNGDMSDGPIYFYKNELELTYPNDGETVTRGEPVTITWTEDEHTDYVTLELWKDGEELQDIYYYLENNNSYEWTPLQALTPDNDYTIKIISFETGEFDYTDTTFTIE